MTTTGDVLGLLGDDDGVVRACEAIGGKARDGRTGELLELALALEANVDPKRVAAFETTADHVEEQLALVPGKAAVDAVLTLLGRERMRSVEKTRSFQARARALASRLGYGQTTDTFLDAIERANESAIARELCACWMHELVLRGHTLGDVKAARDFAGRLVDHPLGALPLELSPVEREAPSYMPLYGDRGIKGAIDSLASGPMSARTVPPPAAGLTIAAKRVDDAVLLTRMKEAVVPWTDAPSGRADAHVFALTPAIEHGVLGPWILRALPLPSTAESPRLDVSRTGPEAVFGSLFAAAANGGAYSSGLSGAYGRRAAWRSLGALVGEAEGTPIAAIARTATRSAFLTFRAPGPWFYDIAWDLGVLALRPEGTSVAVLAATDTD